MFELSNYEYTNAEIVEKTILVDDILKMVFSVENCKFTAPGQYVQIKIKGTNLEEEFSMSEYDSNRFTVVFRATDVVSKNLSLLEIGDEVLVVTGLGNGYDLDEIPSGVSIIADTMGVPEMLGLVKELLICGKECNLVLGFASKDKIFMIDSFRNLCKNIEILTMDGSNGREGRADDGIRDAEYVCASGSLEMLDRLSKKAKSGQFNVDGTNVVKF